MSRFIVAVNLLCRLCDLVAGGCVVVANFCLAEEGVQNRSAGPREDAAEDYKRVCSSLDAICTDCYIRGVNRIQ